MCVLPVLLGRYMVAWVVGTFFGLGFTTAMVTSLCDPNLSFQETMRAVCPSCITGSRSIRQIREGAHRSANKRAAAEEFQRKKTMKDLQKETMHFLMDASFWTWSHDRVHPERHLLEW